jgi:hypothetical protein
MAEKTILGKNLLLKVDGVAIGCATSNSFSSEREMVDGSCKESGEFYDGTPGMITATLSTDGLVKVDTPADPTKTRGYDLLALHLAGTKIEFAFGTVDSGEKTIEGSCFINSIEITGESEGNATYSASMQVVGAYTIVTNA